MNEALTYLRDLPKAELHVHLDGSLRLSTFIELAKESRVQLPSYTESGLIEILFKKSYPDLRAYLACFAYTDAVLKNPEHLERAAYELALDNHAEHVYFVEVRFAPQQHISRHLHTMLESMRAVDQGLKRAAHEINSSEQVMQGQTPHFAFGITCCAMRSFLPDDHYFGDLVRRSSSASPAERLQQAALELVHASVAARENEEITVVGVDVAGQELGWDVRLFAPAFRYAKEHGLHTTAHAGEELGLEIIYEAIAMLGVERIGHGLHLFDRVKDGEYEQQDRALLKQVIELIHDRNIAIETCPSSNFQTDPLLHGNLKNHVIRHLLDHQIATVICTDNRLVSHTTLTAEYERVAGKLALGPDMMGTFARRSFEHAFFPGSRKERDAYITKAQTIIEKIVETAGTHMHT
ncbi:MAG: adenosine deaminase family protein [Candidatus Dependentiae bacterium]|nr:adenosine deaminase family protein [Candidatus Dependentiae bacterium]